MSLNASQTTAFDLLHSFLASNDSTFALQGGAGTGKTYLVSEFVKSLIGSRRVVVAAPTHKACRVLRSKLALAGIPFAFKPKQDNLPGLDVVITDTTAALLGVRPVISDDQTEEEIAFAASQGGGSLPGYLSDGGVLLIDEVSMVGRDDALLLKLQSAQRNCKVIFVGDEGQLPPVKKQAIDFSKDFDQSYTLREVVRQAAGSKIITLAWAIRNGEEDFEQIEGEGLVRSENVAASFLAQVEQPVDDEGERSVFVAYRNATVNAVQEAACQKLYGHSARSFKAGELVLATRAGYAETYGYYTDKRTGQRRLSRFPRLEQVVANADQLRVVDFDSAHVDPIYGTPVTLDRVDLPAGDPARIFEAFYLSAEQIADPAHPYNVRKQELSTAAKTLQQQTRDEKAAGKKEWIDTDSKRKDAWKRFFEHEQKIISFSHCFAQTSHKSQGSTYRTVFVATAELLRYNKKSLYVAVTRPRLTLVW
jgi:hypothetical protein